VLPSTIVSACLQVMAGRWPDREVAQLVFSGVPADRCARQARKGSAPSNRSASCPASACPPDPRASADAVSSAWWRPTGLLALPARSNGMHAKGVAGTNRRAPHALADHRRDGYRRARTRLRQCRSLRTRGLPYRIKPDCSSSPLGGRASECHNRMRLPITWARARHVSNLHACKF
jgi:hypothetical protein